MTQKDARELAEDCRWDLGNEPPPGDPKNKDFMEADISKIELLILRERQEAEKLGEEVERLKKQHLPMYYKPEQNFVCNEDPTISGGCSKTLVEHQQEEISSLKSESSNWKKLAGELVEALKPFSNPNKTSYGARIINESCYPKAMESLAHAKEMGVE